MPAPQRNRESGHLPTPSGLEKQEEFIKKHLTKWLQVRQIQREVLQTPLISLLSVRFKRQSHHHIILEPPFLLRATASLFSIFF